MKVPVRIVLFIILVLFATEALTIFRYERLMKSRERDMKKWQEVSGAVSANKKYSARDIIALIRSSPGWLGDSVTIFDNGEMQTSLARFQGTINNVLSSKPNMDIVMGEMQTNKLPFQYNVYVLAAAYYRQQYPDTMVRSVKH